ncbi:translation initiation factor eIF3e [Schizosaccharomyces pombe]|uniref:Eukaryotic translation initiation factor 3 subunit E n=1 Tax=Schizosaccharomyces pombe (strain 972 / ATCC 24843) TaxID=284812 RepID=EIF3E_SCHPO|nr:eukaryotic translation initiation factor 3 subunit E [Schizosaccharomyces pombe]O94513.1 RecName: Full=Eukaryotic translation initiation factor 3 subunit E; Short=eIF3e [Schizosaccharomyces pombe 972h-]AAG41139.1 Yin6p [Schizosaccharomyces pombe]CAA22813.1 eIF3e subunit Int6 [Schizosaccharomyces pombe]|eukprot:NP_595367.1 eukaryotic translation initiation factor 3 subunit E [Schizosaccharomyces pombe]
MGSELKSTSPLAVKYDLSQKIMQHLDRHLIFPLLEFLSLRQTHDPKELLQAKYDLLKDTNMTDYVANLWTNLHGGHTDEDMANAFAEKRRSVLQELSELEEEVQGILGVLENPDLIAALRQDKGQNLQHLQEHYNITPERIAVLYKFAQFQYNCGNYGGASDLLYHFRAFSKDPELNASATWGKFASEILTVDWDGAMEELGKLREMVDSKSFKDSAVQLRNRTWLLHWSLFPLFNHANGCDTLCDLFFYTPYLNTIQTSCPWLLRYLTVAVVTNQNNANQKPRNPRQSYQRRMRDLVRIISQENYEYSDPVTSFISALYTEVDFEKAQHCLRECEEVLKTDFFLVSLCDHFLEGARKLLAEAYCRIHSVISVDVLANKLEMDSAQLIQLVENRNNPSVAAASNVAADQSTEDESIESTSTNVVADDLITEAETATEAEEPEPEVQFGFKAKLDGESIIIEHPTYSAFQQIIDRTKSLSFESQNLEQSLAKSISELKHATV